MVRKTKFWAIMFSVVFVIGLAAFLWLRSSGKAEGAVARIWLDGELYEEIELDAVVMPYEFDVTTAPSRWSAPTAPTRSASGRAPSPAAMCP